MGTELHRALAGLLKDFIHLHRDEFEEFCHDKADGNGSDEIEAIYCTLGIVPDNE